MVEVLNKGSAGSNIRRREMGKRPIPTSVNLFKLKSAPDTIDFAFNRPWIPQYMRSNSPFLTKKVAPTEIMYLAKRTVSEIGASSRQNKEEKNGISVGKRRCCHLEPLPPLLTNDASWDATLTLPCEGGKVIVVEVVVVVVNR